MPCDGCLILYREISRSLEADDSVVIEEEDRRAIGLGTFEEAR